MEEVKKMFYDPESGFNSLNKFWMKVKEKGINVKLKDVREWYNKQDTNQVNKQTKRPKQYLTILAPHIRYNYQMDIIVYDRYTINNYKYILCVVDVYSRYASTRAMTNRENSTILKNMKEIFKEMGKPENINCDNEFNQPKILEYFQKEKIIPHFSAVGELNKNAIVERFNRTIAGLIQKWRIGTREKTWYKALPKLTNSFNTSYHRTVRGIPKEIFEGRAENKQQHIIQYIPTNLQVGDKVRIKIEKKVLQKGDYIRWSQEIYIITKIKGKQFELENVETKEQPSRLYKDYEIRKADEIQYLETEKEPPTEGWFEKEMDENKKKRIIDKAQRELKDYTTASDTYIKKNKIKGKRQPKTINKLNL